MDRSSLPFKKTQISEYHQQDHFNYRYRGERQKQPCQYPYAKGQRTQTYGLGAALHTEINHAHHFQNLYFNIVYDMRLVFVTGWEDKITVRKALSHRFQRRRLSRRLPLSVPSATAAQAYPQAASG